MKKVYALHGPSASGKSSFIKAHNLEANTLSLDTFRELFSGLDSNAVGGYSLSEQSNELVTSYFKKAFEKRMFMGGVLFLDNLNAKYSDVKDLKELASKYGYDFKMIDFSDVSLEQCIENNKKRVKHKRFADFTIESIYKKIQESKESFQDKEIEFVSPSEALSEFNLEVEDYVVNLNGYKKIHHIGDLQGCFTPLKDYLEQEGGLKDDEFYIFVGDYIDRGIENAEVVKWMLEEGLGKDNIVFLKGNHERHLIHHAHDLIRPASVFVHKTLPEFHRAGIKKEELKSIVPHLKNWFAYEYDNKKVFVNHAGAGNVVERPNLLNNSNFLFGYGGHGYDVDKTFTKNNKDTPWYQVHGHRNCRGGAVNLSLKSFSLESEVEFNGYLSCLKLDGNGFDLKQVPSNIYDEKELKKKEKDMFETRKNDNLEKFITKRLQKDISNVEIMENLRNSELIREKEYGHISSFNFTKKAFFKKSFDDELISTARGLFVNNETGEIIARGYDKFFNIDEKGVEASKMETIDTHLTPPFKCFEKENGFLGVSGYDSKRDELFLGSKSTPEGPFAEWFKEIMSEQLGEEKMDALKKFFKQHNAGAVFEVNDPVNDPHIVEYDKRHVVLLDVLKRDYEFQKLNYDSLKKLGDDLGIPVKKKGPVFNDFKKFNLFYNSVTNDDPFTTNKKFEGYVVEDANGNMNKIKLPYYNFWKEMRGLRDKVVSCEKKEKDYNLKDLINSRPLLKEHEEKAHDFMKWVLSTNSIDELSEKNVIKMREDYFDAQHPEEKPKSKSSLSKRP